MRTDLDGRDEVRLGPGEFFVVPRGVQHNPVVIEGTKSIEDQLSGA